MRIPLKPKAGLNGPPNLAGRVEESTIQGVQLSPEISVAIGRWSGFCWAPLINSLGAAALYGLTVVVVTSYFRVELGRRTWKALHYTAYAAAALFFAHGIFTDPELKGRPTDFFDGEKVLVEGCLLIVLLAVGWRVRYGRQRQLVRR